MCCTGSVQIRLQVKPRARHTASLRLIGKELWAWELGAKLLEDRGVEGRALC